MDNMNQIEKAVYSFMVNLDSSEPDVDDLKTDVGRICHLWDDMTEKDRELVVEDPFVAGAIQLFVYWRDLTRFPEKDISEKSDT
jgi:hypothetical protein